MFDIIKNTLLWKQTFDSCFSSGMSAAAFAPFDCRRLQEKRAFWREQGRPRYNLTPNEASFRAFREFADEYYFENRNRPDIGKTFEELANALEWAAPYFDRNGKYCERETFLSDRWKDYFDQYKKRRKAEEETFNEVLTHRFSKDEIDEAWNRICSGDIPNEAVRIWQAADKEKIAHDIVSDAKVSVRDFVFWMVVFREHHLMMEKQYAVIQHRYVRNNNGSKALFTLIARLNEGTPDSAAAR